MGLSTAVRCTKCRNFLINSGSCKASDGSYYGRRVIMPAREITCKAFVRDDRGNKR